MTVRTLLTTLNSKKPIMPLTLSIMFSLLSVIGVLHADSERYTDYNYDGAGNIILVRSARNLGAPDVTNLSPAFIHKESIAFITATGTNLAKVKASINQPGVSLIDVLNISETEVKLAFVTDETAQIGLVPITFSTRLGSDIENLAVVERTPVVSTNPNPIILTPDKQAVTVGLTFDKAFETDQIFDLKITDSAIASIALQQITLLTGQTDVSVDITGVAAGSTTLEINQLSNFLALTIPTIVIDQPIPSGSYNQYSKPVGVAAYVDEPLTTNQVRLSVSKPIGVGAYIDKSSNSKATIVSKIIGVGAYLEQGLNNRGTFVSDIVGVSSYIDQGVNTNGSFVSNSIGSTYETDVDQVTPQIITAPSTITLTIDGIGLDAVSAISFSPNDGITQIAPFTITPDGQQISVSLDVAITAVLGSINIIFTTSDGNQSFLNGKVEISN